MISLYVLPWKGCLFSEPLHHERCRNSQAAGDAFQGARASIQPSKASSSEFATASSARQQQTKLRCHGLHTGMEDAQPPALPAEGDLPAGRPAGLGRRNLLSSIALGTSVAASSFSVGAPLQWMTDSTELASLEAIIGLRVLPAEAKEAVAKADETKLLEQNMKIQRLNGAPANFPNFIREGFNVKVVIGPEYTTTPSGLIYLDIIPGSGDTPVSGQQIIFHYIGYNEQGRRVDSTYLKGAPARTRLGINGLIPGFEEGITSMRQGGKRRIVIPPELGPPTGPSTFFSAKLYEVFDVELLSVTNCVRRQVAFYSDVVCQ